VKPEHLAAFRKLEDEDLYTAAEVSRLGDFKGDEAEIKRRRRNFYNNLLGLYAERLGDPDAMVPRKGTQYAKSPAWFGKHWKALVDLEA